MSTIQIETRQIESYMLLFKIENLLRVAMHNFLISKIGPNYFNEQTFPKFEINEFGNSREINVVNEAITKKNDEKKYKQSMGFDYPYFWYLDLSELVVLLEEFWGNLFYEIFNNPKNIKEDLFTHLKRLRPLRNAIAHNRYIPIIDYSEIVSCERLVSLSLRKENILNYEQLVFTSIENFKSEILSIINNLLELLQQNKFLDRSLLKNFQSVYTSYNQSIDAGQSELDKFAKLLENLKTYNKLPRKPGVIESYKKFIEENKIILTLQTLIN